MLHTNVHSGRSLGVTSCHDLPPSLVIWTSPSSVPAHSTPSSRGDSAKAKITPE